MCIENYKFLKGPGSEITKMSTDGPLFVADDNLTTWRIIADELDIFLDEKVKEARDKGDLLFQRDMFFEDPRNIMMGSMNLINFIIESHSSEPVKTLVFMDKAGRMAAHSFRKLWSILEKQGKIRSDIRRPVIKFINVGVRENYKYEGRRSYKLSGEIFSDLNREDNGVVVVDEIVLTGGSLKRALKLLNDNYGVKSKGISNFGSSPQYYLLDEQKGVMDAPLNKDTFDFVETLGEESFDFLKSVLLDLDETSALSFISSPKTWTFDKFFDEYNISGHDGQNRELLLNLYNHLRNLPANVTPEKIYYYFKTYGGFLTIQMKRKQRETSFRFRAYLTKMAELFSDYVDLKS